MSDELFENMELKIITPPPRSVANGAGGSIHTFDAAANADDLHIWFRFDARQIGPIEFDVGLADSAGGRPGELVRLRQFAYP